MASILGTVPIHKNHNLLAKDVLAGKLVLFYFSAYWCPPCRRFSKILKKFYIECRLLRPDVEVVFVSSDRSEQEMREYLSIQAEWYYLPFGHSSIPDLSRRFEVGGIPCVVVVSPSGDVISTKGRHEIEFNGETSE
ncbi:hypothetical protein PRIPAC_90441 [Pristionchus pacificus]|uniref:protein-disulfide reductase n=1 Tax=Pristionchus pacificus TaxID=54126 RepID=A0A8R1YV62_PRIPA|nr:hypothetical protein PRIPAC_90441 [Pristionchus pacificus]